MSDEPRLLKATALNVQGLREARRIAAEAGIQPETAAFVGYMFGLELAFTLARTDLDWAKEAQDELALLNAAIGQGERRVRQRQTLLAQATAIIRATKEP